jgi:hypothetical protein
MTSHGRTAPPVPVIDHGLPLDALLHAVHYRLHGVPLPLLGLGQRAVGVRCIERRQTAAQFNASREQIAQIADRAVLMF